MRRSPIRCLARRPLRSLLLAALVSLLVPAAALALGNGKLQIHHVDIGQGDGMLLISPLGQTALFDDGNYLNCSGIKSYLQGLGITTVDYHFCSHYHADHLGCIDDLAAIGITVGTAGYDRGYSYSSGAYTSYVNTLGSKRMTVAKNQVITLDAGAANPVTIKCVDLNGAGVYSVSGSDENAKSVVYKVTYGAFDEVIGGDLTGSSANGNDVETTVGPEVGDVEVYKVHHHGSRYSTNDNWLNAVTAEVGVIQVGDGNSYGHPTADALTRLHNHGVKTYWNETGAGATPDPSWDKVGGTIVVQADPGVGATYTVAGNGFTDSYTNGGGSPPVIITETVVPSSVTMLLGTVSGGSVASLAANDASRMTVTAAKSGSKYGTNWYGSAVLAHPPVKLTLTYDGNYSVNRTQTLYLWNFSTGAWSQVDQATVSTSDVTRTYITTTPGAYVSGAGEVRARVSANTRNSSYTCRADYMAFTYDYQQGTGITVAVSDFHAIPDPEWEALHSTPPQGQVARLSAEPAAGGVRLTWATDRHGHVDGFNVYRESAAGEREFAGNEALLETTSDDVVFAFTDHAPNASGTYWLGVRSCAGPEGLIGPFRVAADVGAGRVSLAAAPNPAQGGTRFSFTVEREADVTLEVFDIAGRKVATPFAGKAAPGAMSVDWALAKADGSRIAAGIYFARLEGLGRTLYTRVTVLER